MAEFFDIRWNKRRLEVTGKLEDKGLLNLWFEASRDWNLNADIVAIALTSLCEKKYDKLYFDLECSRKIIERIRNFTGADVACRAVKNTELDTTNRGGYALNFSGGFDSLAAYCLLPRTTYLISMDFGTRFEREKNFFKKFNPIIVKSNFREFGFEKHSWTFMAIGTILFSETLNLKYDIWGTILEATAWQFVRKPVAAYNTHTEPFYSIGLLDARITNAFTEVGTVMIITKYLPEEVNESLSSLASDGSEKKYRKWLLARIVCRKYKRNVNLIPVDPPHKKPVPWGTNLALDFLALYELKNEDQSVVENTVCNIPQEALDIVSKLQLNFYERMNTNFMATIPREIMGGYMQRVLNADILPYTEEDWFEFDIVMKLLAKYHKFTR